MIIFLLFIQSTYHCGQQAFNSMNCPKCNCNFYIKNGIINGMQRFRCKCCGHNYTVEKKSSSIDTYKKRIALILYLEGMNVTTIAQKLEVSHVSVIKWIRKYGNNLEHLRAQISGINNNNEDNDTAPEELQQ